METMIGGDDADDNFVKQVKKDPKIISKAQINQNVKTIFDRQPLKEKARLYHIIPCLRKCVDKKK